MVSVKRFFHAEGTRERLGKILEIPQGSGACTLVGLKLGVGAGVGAALPPAGINGIMNTDHGGSQVFVCGGFLALRPPASGHGSVGRVRPALARRSGAGPARAQPGRPGSGGCQCPWFRRPGRLPGPRPGVRVSGSHGASFAASVTVT
jgi:hypothetical protein